jgi:hypothetical protein
MWESRTSFSSGSNKFAETYGYLNPENLGTIWMSLVETSDALTGLGIQPVFQTCAFKILEASGV